MKWIYLLCLVIFAVNHSVRSQPRPGPKPKGLPPTATKRGSRPKDAPPPRITKNTNNAWKTIPPPPGSPNNNNYNQYNNPNFNQYNQYGRQNQPPYAHQNWQQQQYRQPGYNQYNQRFNGPYNNRFLNPPPSRMDPNSDMYLTIDKHPPILTRNTGNKNSRRITSSKHKPKPKPTPPPTVPTTYSTDWVDFTTIDSVMTTTEPTTTTTTPTTTTTTKTTTTTTTTTPPPKLTTTAQKFQKHFRFNKVKPNFPPIPRPPPTRISITDAPVTAVRIESKTMLNEHGNKALEPSPWNQDGVQTKPGTQRFNDVAGNNNPQQYQNENSQLTSLKSVQTVNKVPTNNNAMSTQTEKPTMSKSWLTGGSTFRSSSVDHRTFSTGNSDTQRTLKSKVAGYDAVAQNPNNALPQNDINFDYGGQTMDLPNNIRSSSTSNAWNSGTGAQKPSYKTDSNRSQNNVHNTRNEQSRYDMDVMGAKKHSGQSYLEPKHSTVDRNSVPDKNYRPSDKTSVSSGSFSKIVQSDRIRASSTALGRNDLNMRPKLTNVNQIPSMNSKYVPTGGSSSGNNNYNDRSFDRSGVKQSSTYSQSSYMPDGKQMSSHISNTKPLEGTLHASSQKYEHIPKKQQAYDLTKLQGTQTFGQTSSIQNPLSNAERTYSQSSNVPDGKQMFSHISNNRPLVGTLHASSQKYEHIPKKQQAHDLTKLQGTQNFGQTSSIQDPLSNAEPTHFQTLNSKSGVGSASQPKQKFSMDISGQSSIDISYVSGINKDGQNSFKDKNLSNTKQDVFSSQNFNSVSNGASSAKMDITYRADNRKYSSDSTGSYMSADKVGPTYSPSSAKFIDRHQSLVDINDHGRELYSSNSNIKPTFSPLTTTSRGVGTGEKPSGTSVYNGDRSSAPKRINNDLATSGGMANNKVLPKLDRSSLKELKIRLELEKLIRKRLTNTLTPADKMKLIELKQEYQVWKQQKQEAKKETISLNPSQISQSPGPHHLPKNNNEATIQQNTINSKQHTKLADENKWNIVKAQKQENMFNLQQREKQNYQAKHTFGNNNNNKVDSPEFINETQNVTLSTDLNAQQNKQMYNNQLINNNGADRGNTDNNAQSFNGQRGNDNNGAQTFNGQRSNVNNGALTYNGRRGHVNIKTQSFNGQRGNVNNGAQSFNGKRGNVNNNAQPFNGQRDSNTDNGAQSFNGQRGGNTDNGAQAFNGQRGGITNNSLQSFNSQIGNTNYDAKLLNGQRGNINNNTQSFNEQRGNADNGIQSFNGQRSNADNAAQSFNGQRGNTNNGAQSFNGQRGNIDNGAQSFNGQRGNIDNGAQSFNGQRGNTNNGAQSFNGQRGNVNKDAQSFNGQRSNVNIDAQSFNGQRSNVNIDAQSFNGQRSNVNTGAQSFNRQRGNANNDAKSFNGQRYTVNNGAQPFNGQSNTNNGAQAVNGQRGSVNNGIETFNGLRGNPDNGARTFNGQKSSVNIDTQTFNGQRNNINNGAQTFSMQRGSTDNNGLSLNGRGRITNNDAQTFDRLRSNTNNGAQSVNGQRDNTNNFGQSFNGKMLNTGSLNQQSNGLTLKEERSFNRHIDNSDNIAQLTNGQIQNTNNDVQPLHGNWKKSESSGQTSANNKDNIDYDAQSSTSQISNSNNNLNTLNIQNGNSDGGSRSSIEQGGSGNYLQHSSSGHSGDSGSGYAQTTIAPAKTCSITPVCGTDGFTYMSDCFLWPGVDKSCDGFCPCDKSSNPTSAPAPARPSKLEIPKPIPPMQSSGPQTEISFIKPSPPSEQYPVKDLKPRCNCPELYRPVCGLKGNTYENDCIRRCNYDGFKCQGKCPCDANNPNYQPDTVADARPDIRNNKMKGPITLDPSSSHRHRNRKPDVKNDSQGKVSGKISKQTNRLNESRNLKEYNTSRLSNTGVTRDIASSQIRQNNNNVNRQSTNSQHGRPKTRTQTTSDVVKGNKHVSGQTESYSSGIVANKVFTPTIQKQSRIVKGPRPSKLRTYSSSKTGHGMNINGTNYAINQPTHAKVSRWTQQNPKGNQGTRPINENAIQPTNGGQRRLSVNKMSESGIEHNAANGKVGNSRSVSCYCSDVYAPVCGSDGVTYQNPCRLSCSAGVETSCTGECPCTTYTVKPTYYCEDYCGTSYEPVCSVSGRTFGNECLRQCSMESKECEGECPCSQVAATMQSSNTNSIYNSADAYVTPPLPSPDSGWPVDPNNFNAEPSNQPLSTCECRPGDIDPVCTIYGETIMNGCEAICLGAKIACSSECPC